jgi:bla regulator protein BlaR1
MELQTAIYTTLLHSLWMGLILALVTSLIILATRKRSAALRYNLLAGSLLIFLMSSIFVFYKMTGTELALKVADQHQFGTSPTFTTQVKTAVDDSFLSSAKSVVAVWGNYANQIVLIWFLIICAKFLQLFIGLQSISVLKSSKVFNAGSFWEEKVEEIAEKLCINRPVKILQSGLAKVPMIIGHFKPIILIPLGLLNNLAVKEVEAILSHELAHLKRNDYLVNLVQSFIEIVFFFNPGVLWVSKLIKEERENCCDDLALSCIESKHQYIKALITCQEFSSSYPNYAMAIVGRKSTLKDRVRRMVFGNNSSLNRVEKTLLSLVLISVLIFTTAFTKVKNFVANEGVITVKEVFFQEQKQDTTRKSISTKNTSRSSTAISKQKNLDRSQQKIDAGIQTAASREIKKSRMTDKSQYQEEIKSYQEEVKRYQEDVKAQQNELKNYQANILKYQRDVKKYQADVRKYSADPANNKLPVVPIAPAIPETPEAPVAPTLSELETVRTGSTAMGSVSANTPVKISSNINIGSGNRNIKEQTKDGGMTEELQGDGLLKNLKNFEYTLNEEKLVINGIRQSDKIHHKYLKYLKNKKGTITTVVSTD